MAKIRFTGHLRRFFPGLQEMEVSAPSVAELLPVLEKHYPGLMGYLVDDQGQLRKHVNCFVDGAAVGDRQRLSDPLGPASEVFWVQALSGG